MLVAHSLCINASQQLIIKNRTNQSSNTNSHIINDNNLNNSSNEQIKSIEKVMEAIKKN